MEDIRERVQQRAIQAWLNDVDRKGIIDVAPRVGKSFIGLRVANEIEATRILIIYPRVDIQKGWEEAAYELGFDRGRMDFVTTMSLRKVDTIYDFIICDEVHEYSQAQVGEVAKLTVNTPVIGLTGTITATVERELKRDCKMDVVFRYPINKAVEDGILSPYTINIHLVELDDVERVFPHKGYSLTEKKEVAMWEKLSKKQKTFAELKIISLLQKSETKRQATLRMIEQYRDERLIVFCGQTEIADSLGIPVYHSKAKEKTILDDFCEGRIPQLATINMLAAGIKIKPIDRAVFGYTSGAPAMFTQKLCRVLAYEHTKKHSQIDIICSNTTFERQRLLSALSFLDSNRIIYHE